MRRYLLVLTILTGLGAAALETAGDVPLPPALDLQTAQRVALRDNPGMAAAEARVRQAEARVRQVRAGYLPRLDATVSGAKTWLSENDYRTARTAALAAPFQQFQAQLVGGGGGLPLDGALLALFQGIQARRAVPDSFETYQAELSASWTLFDGFAREFSLAAARYGRDETAAAHAEAQRLLLEAVAQSFFDVQLAREGIAIAESDEAFNARQLEEAHARRRVGTGSLSDVLNFEVRVNAAREQLIRARRDHALARIALAELMALPRGLLPEQVDAAPLEDGEAAEGLPLDADALVEHALAHRPDLERARRTHARQKANVGAQRSAYMPTVSAFASHRADSGEGFDWGRDDFATTAGVAVTYTLFAGGRNRARVAEARAGEREALWDLASLENAVTAQVRQAVEGVEAAVATLRLQRANAENGRRNRDLVEKEYAAGQGSLVRLNEAQRDLTASEASLAAARVGVHRALHQLQTAAAQTFPEHRVE